MESPVGGVSADGINRVPCRQPEQVDEEDQESDADACAGERQAGSRLPVIVPLFTRADSENEANDPGWQPHGDRDREYAQGDGNNTQYK